MLETTTTKPDRALGEPWKWPCVSACFLIWIAGTDRLSMSGYDKTEGHFGIGLHRPYFSPEAYSSSPAVVAEAQQAMTGVVRDYLRREQVPEQFIDKMLERSSREVYWLYEGGDPFALNGKAAWFEEMMIARCAFDPAYVRESEAAGARSLALGRPLKEDPAKTAYFAWKQKYNSCEHQARSDAQAAMRR